MKVLKVIVPIAVIVATYLLIRADILIVWSALFMCGAAAYLLKQGVEYLFKKFKK